MFDLSYSVEFGDHILEFNDIDLISAKYVPDWSVYIDVDFGTDYLCLGKAMKDLI